MKEIERKNKIYLIHCWDGTKDDGWYPWLDKKISDSDNQFIRLNMPDSANPRIEKWVGELEKQIDEIDEHTYFVGHSIGCQTILRYLEKQNVEKIGGILFVAPWLDLLSEAVGDQESFETARPWLETPIDFDAIKKMTDDIVCIFSDDDYFVSLDQAKEFQKLLNAKIIVVHKKGHISADDNINELDEIYEALTKIIGAKL